MGEFRECDELLYGRRCPLKLKAALNKSYLRSAILYGNKSVSESVMGILQWTERSMVRAMCGVQLNDRERSEDLMLDLKATKDQLAMVNCVRWYGHVLWREDGRYNMTYIAYKAHICTSHVTKGKGGF